MIKINIPKKISYNKK